VESRRQLTDITTYPAEAEAEAEATTTGPAVASPAAQAATAKAMRNLIDGLPVPLKASPPRCALPPPPFLNHEAERVGAPFRKNYRAIVKQSRFPRIRQLT
jgi:hypothetical protein